MGNPNHDEKGKFASEAQERANSTGIKQHVVTPPHLPGPVILNDGQIKNMKNMKQHIVSTHNPPKQQIEQKVRNIQAEQINRYFDQVKKRGF